MLFSKRRAAFFSFLSATRTLAPIAPALKASGFVLAFSLASLQALATEIHQQTSSVEPEVQTQSPAHGEVPATDRTSEPSLLAETAPDAVEDSEEESLASSPSPLSLLGREITPGVFHTLYWSPGQSFASIDTPVPVLVARGNEPGPTVCLTAAVHGDELNGIEMVRRLMYQLEPVSMKGTVIGVPIVNLDGFRRGSRYLADRRDLNRHFPGIEDGSAASRIAYSLFNQVIKGRCQFLVDLHTGSLKRTNLPQLRADLTNEDVFEFSRHFGGITVLHGRGGEGTLRRAATDAGIPAITLESGGPNALEESAVDGGVKALETMLQNLDVQPTLRFWGTPQPVFYHSVWVRSDQGGMLMSDIELGDSVNAGDILGHVVDPVSNTGSDIVAPVSGRIIGMAFNQVVQTGFAAYHIGEAKTPEEAKEEALEDADEHIHPDRQAAPDPAPPRDIETDAGVTPMENEESTDTAE